MTTRKRSELDKIDVKLANMRSRLMDVYAERERLEEELKQKGVKRSERKSLKARLAAINSQIQQTESEEWDADSERYDLLYYPQRR
jgi:seryl-tRNA synthetase